MIYCVPRLATLGGLAALLLASVPATALAAERVEVADELARLAQVHGFVVSGLEQTDSSFGRADGDELYFRLRLLLENFDHVIVQGPAGDVDRVIVLGEKVPVEPPPPLAVASDTEAPGGGDIVVETERRGSQHLVRVSLEAKEGVKVERNLHLDTGADYLVLPLSLVSELGVDRGTLDEREMQTANGAVKALIGTLPSLWLGERRIRNVETAFLEDDKLGGTGLLGMSVLRRYKLTIDDDRNRITLGSKDGDSGARQGSRAQAGSVGPGGRNP